MEEVVRDENLAPALGAVTRNQGAPGIDDMKTTEVESHFQAHWPNIRMTDSCGDSKLESASTP